MHNHTSTRPSRLASSMPNLLAAVAFLSSSLFLGESAFADGDHHKKHHHKRDMNITEVFVTFGDAAFEGRNTITVLGEGFGSGRSLKATLGSFPDPLVILEVSDTQIIAECPTSIMGDVCPAGDYLLTVSAGKRKRRSDEWDRKPRE